MPLQHTLVERFQLFVLPGTDIQSAAAAVIHELTSPIPPGFLSGCWGTVLEDPNKIEFWLTWDTLASHVSFSTLTKVNAITQILIPIAAATPVVYHVAFTSEFHCPPTNAVAEVLTFTPATRDVRLPSRRDERMEGYLGHVQGKALERVEGKKVRVLVVRWNDENGRGSERWSQGLRIDVAEHDMRVERCHIKLWPF